jgi:CDP-diacylglycerol--serine O-phosphatidyltransferase
LVVANHAMNGVLEDERYTLLLFGVTTLVSLLMVSTVKFRSFKDLRLNTGTVLFVLFLVVSSAFVWQRLKPAFVLVWLLSFYVAVGLVETLRELALRLARSRDRLPRSSSPR